MITLKVKELKFWKDRITGLIGREKPIPLLLQTRFGIHTFGLKFPIDVLILDNSNRVMKYKSNLRSNTFFFWNPRFYKVLELPAGTIEKLKVKYGDEIRVTLE